MAVVHGAPVALPPAAGCARSRRAGAAPGTSQSHHRGAAPAARRVPRALRATTGETTRETDETTKEMMETEWKTLGIFQGKVQVVT